MVGLFSENRLCCVAGFIVYPHVTHGRDLWIHDLVTSSDCRSQGMGRLLLIHIRNLANGIGCKRVCVHTRNTNEAAQKFYLEHAGYEKYAIVFHLEV